MHAPRDGSTAVLLPPRLPDTPVILQCTASLAKLGKYSYGVYVSEKDAIPECLEYVRSIDHTVNRGQSAPRLRIRVYFIGRYLVQLDNERIWSVRVYDGPVSGRRVLLVTENTATEALTLRAVKREDIPKRLRDPEALARTWPHRKMRFGRKVFPRAR
jgi:hypothetical protein